MSDETDHFEVVVETHANDDEVPLGKASTLVDACQMIETVDQSKYTPIEYHIRPASADTERDDEVSVDDE